jgi:hypothetical protein
MELLLDPDRSQISVRNRKKRELLCLYSIYRIQLWSVPSHPWLARF